MSTWTRIESVARSIGLDGGLEARIGDPLWALARQWQVAEFRGDDAAQPVGVRVTAHNTPLTGVKGISGQQLPLPAAVPLEAAVEAAAGPDFGAAGLNASARASRRLIRLLVAAGLSGAVAALRSAFPLTSPDRQVTLGNAGAQTARLLTRWGIDAAKLAGASPDVVGGALAKALSPADTTRAKGIVAIWVASYRRRDGETRSLAWDDRRLEYRFSLSAGDNAAQSPATVELQAPEHNGGHLDWYTFNVVSSARGQAVRQEQTHTALPTPIHYAGMPASRWWQFENSAINFGGLEAGPADLARLLVAEFATSYSANWFLIPLTVPVGSLTEITRLEVIDNFGGRNQLRSTAVNDARRSGGSRAWRMFELTGDEVSDEHPSPWLLVAPTLAGGINGPILERVLLTRDEGANLVWAIEGLVEGPLGRAVDRSDAWYAAQSAEQRPARSEEPPTALSSESERWRYRLEELAPAWWIPFVPERISADNTQIRLRRARMHAWDLVSDERAIAQLGPQGLFLDPRQARWILEEEVPRSGVRIERRWQFGRWHDGSYHVWLQRRKLAGRGERSSGLRWDFLLPGE